MRFCAILFVLSVLPWIGINAAAEEPVKIGVIYGFSGAAQKWSEYGRKGIDLAVNEINAAGGVAGRPLEVVYEDNRTDPKQSVASYRKLKALDKVDAIVASNWSILTNPLIPLTQKDRIVVVSPTVMDSSVESKSDYFFTMGYRIESVRAPIRRFFELNQAVKKVAFLCWEDAWGRANLKVWEEEARARDVEVVETICHGDHSSDFRTEVTKISGKNPDAIFVAMYPERAAQRLQELRIKLPIFTTSAVLEALQDPQIPAILFENMFFAYWPPSESFRERYVSKYGAEPILEAHNHYEVVHALAKGLAQAPEPLLSSMKKISYTGVAGRIDFRESPFVNYGAGTLMQVSGREFGPVG